VTPTAAVSVMQKQIIQKLYIHSYIGAKHTSQENIPKNFPKHLKRTSKKGTSTTNKTRHNKPTPNKLRTTNIP